MSQLPADQERWVPCAPGSLVMYAVQRQRRHRRRTAIKIAAATLSIALVAGVGWLANRNTNPTEMNFGGIACHDVARLMPQYLTGELPAEQNEKIRLHLAQCPKCQEMMRQMQQQQATGAVGAIESNCPECQEQLAALLAAESYPHRPQSESGLFVDVEPKTLPAR